MTTPPTDEVESPTCDDEDLITLANSLSAVNSELYDLYKGIKDMGGNWIDAPDKDVVKMVRSAAELTAGIANRIVNALPEPSTGEVK